MPQTREAQSIPASIPARPAADAAPDIEPDVDPSGGDAVPGGVRQVKSALRTIEVMEFLASRQGASTRLRDVSDGLATPRSSTYALLQTLVSTGWVEVDATGTFYSVGIRTLLAGTSYIDRDPHVRLVHPVIADLAHELGETFHMARLDGGDVVYLATAESHEYDRLLPRVGRRLPVVHTSLGKSILAERGDAVPATMPAPLTARSITTLEDLRADLDRTRRRGWAIDDEENTPGVRCIGVALRYDRVVRDAISCSVPLARMDAAREQRIVESMQRARQRIEASAPAVPGR